MKCSKHILAVLAVMVFVTACHKVGPKPAPVPTNPGDLVEVQRTWTITTDDAIELVRAVVPDVLEGEYASLIKTAIRTRGDMKFASIVYLTTGVDGNIVHASGVVAYPVRYIEELNKIVSIQHVSCDIDQAPSEILIAMDMLPVYGFDCKGTGIIGRPFVAVMADYLGYGVSRTPDLKHPYMHNGLTGSCCADMLEAAQEYLDLAEKIPVPEKVDLIGYSQGGAATLSTMLELLRRNEASWSSRIRSVWVGSGPYDLNVLMDYFKETGEYEDSGYIPYSFRGIAYGEGLTLDDTMLYASTDKYQASELESTLFSKQMVSKWHPYLGTDVTKILHPDFFRENYGDNPEILRLREAMISNSIVSQKAPSPEMVSKIHVLHDKGDKIVPYECSLSLVNAWHCSEVEELDAKNHTEGAAQFMLKYCGLDEIIK